VRKRLFTGRALAQADVIAARIFSASRAAYMGIMPRRKHSVLGVDRVLTDVFVGLLIAALVAGAFAHIHDGGAGQLGLMMAVPSL